MRKLHRQFGLWVSLLIIPLILSGLYLILTIDQSSKKDPVINHIAIHPTNKDVVIWATDQHLFKTSPSNPTKQTLRFKYPSKHISALAFHPSGTLYAAIKQGFLFETSDLSIWKPISIPSSINHIKDLVVTKESLTLITQSNVYQSAIQEPEKWKIYAKQPPTSFFKQWVYQLHTGQLGKGIWKWINIASSIGLLFLIFSGLKLFFFKK